MARRAREERRAVRRRVEKGVGEEEWAFRRVERVVATPLAKTKEPTPRSIFDCNIRLVRISRIDIS